MNIEALPPVIKDGRKSCINISINRRDKTISISHHTVLDGETDNEKIRNPEDYKCITFPFDQLKWLAPRLDGIRHFIGIENGYETKKQ